VVVFYTTAQISLICIILQETSYEHSWDSLLEITVVLYQIVRWVPQSSWWGYYVHVRCFNSRFWLPRCNTCSSGTVFIPYLELFCSLGCILCFAKNNASILNLFDANICRSEHQQDKVFLDNFWQILAQCHIVVSIGYIGVWEWWLFSLYREAVSNAIWCQICVWSPQDWQVTAMCIACWEGELVFVWILCGDMGGELASQQGTPQLLGPALGSISREMEYRARAGFCWWPCTATHGCWWWYFVGALGLTRTRDRQRVWILSSLGLWQAGGGICELCLLEGLHHVGTTRRLGGVIMLMML
jgi:hypothetical protein